MASGFGFQGAPIPTGAPWSQQMPGGYPGLSGNANSWPQQTPMTPGQGFPEPFKPAAQFGAAQQGQPARFMFRPRVGRINWRLLHSIDIDRVIRDGDVEVVQCHMDNITFSRFGKEDLEVLGDDDLIRLVSLSQLTMEFLFAMCNASQQLLQDLMERTRGTSDALKAMQQKNRQLKRQLQSESQTRRRRGPSHTLPDSEPLDGLRAHSRGPSQAIKCAVCSKRFESQHFLNEHMKRRHPEVPHKPLQEPATETEKPVVPAAKAAPPAPAAAAAAAPVAPATAVVHQPKPEPRAEPEPSRTAPDPEAIARIVTKGLRQELEEALQQKLSSVQKEVSNVAKDLAQLRQAPKPASTGAVTKEDVAAIASSEAERESELQKKVEGLLEKNQQELLKKFSVVSKLEERFSEQEESQQVRVARLEQKIETCLQPLQRTLMAQTSNAGDMEDDEPGDVPVRSSMERQTLDEVRNMRDEISTQVQLQQDQDNKAIRELASVIESLKKTTEHQQIVLDNMQKMPAPLPAPEVASSPPPDQNSAWATQVVTQDPSAAAAKDAKKDKKAATQEQLSSVPDKNTSVSNISGDKSADATAESVEPFAANDETMSIGSQNSIKSIKSHDVQETLEWFQTHVKQGASGSDSALASKTLSVNFSDTLAKYRTEAEKMKCMLYETLEGSAPRLSRNGDSTRTQVCAERESRRASLTDEEREPWRKFTDDEKGHRSEGEHDDLNPDDPSHNPDLSQMAADGSMLDAQAKEKEKEKDKEDKDKDKDKDTDKDKITDKDKDKDKDKMKEKEEEKEKETEKDKNAKEQNQGKEMDKEKEKEKGEALLEDDKSKGKPTESEKEPLLQPAAKNDGHDDTTQKASAASTEKDPATKESAEVTAKTKQEEPEKPVMPEPTQAEKVVEKALQHSLAGFLRRCSQGKPGSLASDPLLGAGAGFGSGASIPNPSQSLPSLDITGPQLPSVKEVPSADSSPVEGKKPQGGSPKMIYQESTGGMPASAPAAPVPEAPAAPTATAAPPAAPSSNPVPLPLPAPSVVEPIKSKADSKDEVKGENVWGGRAAAAAPPTTIAPGPDLKPMQDTIQSFHLESSSEDMVAMSMGNTLTSVKSESGSTPMPVPVTLAPPSAHPMSADETLMESVLQDFDASTPAKAPVAHRAQGGWTGAADGQVGLDTGGNQPFRPRPSPVEVVSQAPTPSGGDQIMAFSPDGLGSFSDSNFHNEPGRELSPQAKHGQSDRTNISADLSPVPMRPHNNTSDSMSEIAIE